jgi:hypothetical protein
MQTPANEPRSPKKALGWKTALPPIFLSFPVIIAGFFVLALGFDSERFPDFAFYGLAGLYLFWLLAVWQMHRVLAAASADRFSIKPWQAVFADTLGGPLAASVAAYCCGQLLRLLDWLSNLVSDVLPNSTPIVNSALTLVDQYGIFLTIAVAAGVAVSCQARMMIALRDFLAERQQPIGRHRSLVAAGVLGIALCAPGCIYLLGVSPQGWQYSVDPSWQTRLLALSYVSCLLCFSIFGWLNRRVAAALKR